jgi:hypothetical protein
MQDQHGASPKEMNRIAGAALGCALLAACSSGPEHGEVAGDVYLVHGMGREVDLTGTQIRLVEDFRNRFAAEMDSLLSPVCVQRNARIAAARQSGGSQEEAVRAGMRWAWRERARLLGERTRRAVVTDPAARFAIDSIEPGNYRLWADAVVDGERISWLAPFRIRAGDSIRVNLSNDNTDDNPFRCRF